MPLTLRWKGSTTLPVEGENFQPEAFSGRELIDICKQPLLVGNQQIPLGDLFDVKGATDDSTLVLEGDLSHVHRTGRGMTSGVLRIHGDCGNGVGQGMLGGEIAVNGSVGDSAGMGMRNGVLRITGSAGHNLGGLEPGARLGMRDGIILVDGSVGDDAGRAMRRGFIAIKGDCGEGIGRGMVAGSVFAFGSIGPGMGRGMKRGSIVVFGDKSPKIGAGFWPSGHDRPTFLTIYLRKLRELGFSAPSSAYRVECERYNGDRVEGGQGEILVARPA